MRKEKDEIKLKKGVGWIRENVGVVIILIGVLECTIGELIALSLIVFHLLFGSACIFIGVYKFREKTQKLKVLFVACLLITIAWSAVFCWSVLAYLEYVRTFPWGQVEGYPSNYYNWNGAIYIICAGILLFVAWIGLAAAYARGLLQKRAKGIH